MHQRYKCNRSISHDNVQYEVGQVILLDLTTAESLLQIDAIKQIEEVEGIELPGALQKTDEQLIVLKEIAASLQQISSGFSAVVLTVSELMTRLAAAKDPTSGSASNQPGNQEPVDADAAQAKDQAPADTSDPSIPVAVDTGINSGTGALIAQATDAPSADAAVDSVSNAVSEPAADTTDAMDATGTDAGQDSSELAASEFGASAWPAATTDEEASAATKKAKSKKADK